jgi:F-box/TPR repeat protein Pof3
MVTNSSSLKKATAFLERGRNEYHKKEFASAREAFTNAIEQSSGSLHLDALDHRAATLEKLGDFKAALKDSKRIMDLQPDVAKVRISCHLFMKAHVD